MANTQLGRLVVQGGVRYEHTRTKAENYERDVLGTRQGKYGDEFFSGSVRYRFTPSRMAIASFSQSILRPDLSSMSGVLSVNDTNFTGSLPNPQLRPEHGNNHGIRLEQYFEPAGVFSIGALMFDLSDFHASVTGVPAEAIGLGDDYPGYTFTTITNTDRFRNSGVEVAYNQRLAFLPGVFKNVAVFANYSRFHRSDPELHYRVPPANGSAGISYSHPRFQFGIRGAWAEELLQSETRYRPPTLYVGVNLNVRVTEKIAVIMSGRNITNEGVVHHRRDLRGYNESSQHAGSTWILGVKGTY